MSGSECRSRRVQAVNPAVRRRRVRTCSGPAGASEAQPHFWGSFLELGASVDDSEGTLGSGGQVRSAVWAGCPARGSRLVPVRSPDKSGRCPLPPVLGLASTLLRWRRAPGFACGTLPTLSPCGSPGCPLAGCCRSCQGPHCGPARGSPGPRPTPSLLPEPPAGGACALHGGTSPGLGTQRSSSGTQPFCCFALRWPRGRAGRCRDPACLWVVGGGSSRRSLGVTCHLLCCARSGPLPGCPWRVGGGSPSQD